MYESHKQARISAANFSEFIKEIQGKFFFPLYAKVQTGLFLPVIGRTEILKVWHSVILSHGIYFLMNGDLETGTPKAQLFLTIGGRLSSYAKHNKAVVPAAGPRRGRNRDKHTPAAHEARKRQRTGAELPPRLSVPFGKNGRINGGGRVQVANVSIGELHKNPPSILCLPCSQKKGGMLHR